jgi:hypothetical protein
MSESKAQTCVIDLTGQTKEAALYFDRVVPLSWNPAWKVKLGTQEATFIREISPESLYTSGSRPSKDYVRTIETLEHAMYLAIAKYPEARRAQVQEEFADNAFRMIQARPELHDASFLFPNEDPFPGLDSAADFMITLRGLALVHAEKASWPQIIEFRRDEKSRTALRRLRIFFIREYAGKDRLFIEDDLHSRLEAYYNAVRDWGFETRAATIGNLLNSKTLLGTLGGAALSSLFGAHWAAAAAAATGIAIELGNVALDLAKRRYSLETLRRDHPLNFIISARSSIEG